MDIVDEVSVRQEELVSELLREIFTAESALLPLRTKLDCQHEKVNQMTRTFYRIFLMHEKNK